MKSTSASSKIVIEQIEQDHTERNCTELKSTTDEGGIPNEQ